MTIKFRIEAIHETERCWTATVPVLPEIVTHGATRSEAIAKIQPLALRALANRLEQGTPAPNLQEVLFDVAKEYRLGVLFVHGIGRQRPGDALIQWGDVLVKTIPFAANGPSLGYCRAGRAGRRI